MTGQQSKPAKKAAAGKPETATPPAPEITTAAPAEVTTPPKPETAGLTTESVPTPAPPETEADEAPGVDGDASDQQHLSDDQRVKLCGILGLADDAPESHVLAAVALELLSSVEGQDEEGAEEGPLVEVVMRIHISGTRNGKPLPEIGGRISLPVAEAADYVRCGYAVLPDGVAFDADNG